MNTVSTVKTLAKDAYWDHRRKLAVLCRILSDHGYIGTFGHVSVRVPDTDLVLITPGAGADKATVRSDQIFVYHIDGEVLHHPGGDLTISEPAEWRIHTQIHRDRPEILSVAHLHAPSSTLLGIVNRPIVPVFNQAFYMHKGIPMWDNPRLIVGDESAQQLSKALGDKLAVQMRGHGSTVVGTTPEDALLNCITVEENAKYQIAAEMLGGAVPFPEELMEQAARQRNSLGVAVSTVVWKYFERKALMTGIPV
jgi:ribulose-5-phosphate 4-epimerase/fuculose-1-phosphate aldolase